jgi:hypothetical protein
MNVERVPPVVVAFQLKLLLMAGIGYCGAELRNSWLSWLGATLRLDFDLWEFCGRRLNQRGDPMCAVCQAECREEDVEQDDSSGIAT